MALFATVQDFVADPTRYLLSTWKALWTIVSPFDTRCPRANFLNASSNSRAADEAVPLAKRALGDDLSSQEESILAYVYYAASRQ
jgi:hypothetical protein